MNYEVVWNGGALGEPLERDYAAMRGDGWDLIWEPTSPLTTPWWQYAALHEPDPEQHVKTSLSQRRRGPRRGASRILKDWSREYHGSIAPQGSRR